MNTPLPELDASRSCLFRITEPERKKLENLLFQRHPRREWGTFFRFGYRRTPWGLALSYVDSLPPLPGDLDRQSGFVSFRPQYISRATRELERSSLGLGFIHSHPLGWGVSPSPSDDDMDGYYADLFGPFGGGRPYCSLILNRSSDGALVFSGRAFDSGKWLPVTEFITPTFPYLRLWNRASAKLPMPSLATTAEVVESVTARLELLYGSGAAERLRASRVAVIGCSGTGSPAIECLARAQVGEFVLVDYQPFGPSNLERMHGSSFAHTRQQPLPFKVALMGQMIWEINPTARIQAWVGNILDGAVMDELLHCDLLLGCTDTHHGRAALGDLATRFLVPSIDVGVLPEGKNGKITAELVDVTQYSPELPCPFCSGCVCTWPLTVECMSEDEKRQRNEAAAEAARRGEDARLYWSGGPPQLPTVGHLTTNAGSLIAGYAIKWLAGVADVPHSRFQFDLCSPEFGFKVVNRKRSNGCACGTAVGHGDQADASITRPNHWPPPSRLPACSP